MAKRYLARQDSRQQRDYGIWRTKLWRLRRHTAAASVWSAAGMWPSCVAMERASSVPKHSRLVICVASPLPRKLIYTEVCRSDNRHCSDCGILTYGEFYLNFLIYWKSFIYVMVSCHFKQDSYFPAVRNQCGNYCFHECSVGQPPKILPLFKLQKIWCYNFFFLAAYGACAGAFLKEITQLEWKVSTEPA